MWKSEHQASNQQTRNTKDTTVKDTPQNNPDYWGKQRDTAEFMAKHYRDLCEEYVRSKMKAEPGEEQRYWELKAADAWQAHLAYKKRADECKAKGG